MKELEEFWSLDYYEQNGDHRELNDYACWAAGTVGEDQYLTCSNANVGETFGVRVEGDLVAAKGLLKAELNKKHCWPSLWLGPCQRSLGWDEVALILGLTRTSNPEEFE